MFLDSNSLHPRQNILPKNKMQPSPIVQEWVDLTQHAQLDSKIQSRRLNAVAYTLPCGKHVYAPAYTLCPVQGLER